MILISTVVVEECLFEVDLVLETRQNLIITDSNVRAKSM